MPRSRRTGTIYVLVLLSSLIVGTIGLASLQLVRLQSRTASGNNDFIAARTYARAALEIGMLNIRNDPYWRTNFGNGNWVTNQSIGTGTFSLSAVDPIDNDVTKGDNHPIILTGTGRQGAALFNTSVRLEIGPRVGSCLEVSMISGNDTEVSSATLTSDQAVSANHNYSAGGGSTVNADVEAFGSIGGSTYTQAKLQKTVWRDMPDPLNALDYYLANGTTIPYTALPLWDQNELISNGDFETNVAGWYPITNCTIQQSSSQAKSGTYSMRVRNRLLSSDVAAHDIPVNSFINGNKYRFSMPIFPTATGTARAVLTMTSTGDGVQTLVSPAFNLAKNALNVYTWVDLKGDFTMTWTGTLTNATVSIWISFKNDYYMDKLSLLDITYPSNHYVMDRKLISPTANPFGATNPQGIYIINCGGKDVIIARSRIVGTLVFINPGGNSAIQESVCMEAAVYNFPALLSDKKIKINLLSAGLSEAGIGINLNPPGTPYPFIGGTANETLTESYPSRITGLIYSTDELEFNNTPNVTGVVIADRNIKVKASSLTLSYINTYLNDPPPGFDVGTITMKPVAGTWKRTVD
jgi:Carbohydrate binding domain